MSKMKNLIIEIVDQHRNGITIPQISNFTGLPMDVVFDILKRYEGVFDDEVVLH